MKKRGCFGCFGRIVLVIVLAMIAWAVFSSNPFAQGFRQLLGRKPDQPVLNSSFQIGPHSFRYYQFSLPQGSKNMVLVGDFKAEIANSAGQPATEAAIQVLLLNETAFEAWRQASSASSIYDSGNVRQAKIHQSLPDGAGNYYVVFSNRSDSVSSKKITSNLVLHSASLFSY